MGREILRMSKYLLIGLFCFSIILTCQGKTSDQKSAQEQLSDLAYSIKNESVSEKEYLEVLDKAKSIIEKLSQQKQNPLKPYGGLLASDPTTIVELGPVLSYFSDYFLLYGQSGKYTPLLGSAMIQDERSLPLIVRTIMTIDRSNVNKSAVIGFLALYGKKAEKHIPFLDYMYDNEWRSDAKKRILKVKELILSDRAKSPWERYKIFKEFYKEGKTFCGLEIDKNDFDNPFSHGDSTTNQIKSLTPEEKTLLTSKGLNDGDYPMIWKNVSSIPYIVFKTEGRDELNLIDQFGEVHPVDIAFRTEVQDIFNVGNRIFLVTKTNWSNMHSVIGEVFWDKIDKTFKFSQFRFHLGASYKKLIDENGYYKLEGFKWSYKINKRTAVIESGKLCGDEFIINQAL